MSDLGQFTKNTLRTGALAAVATTAAVAACGECEDGNAVAPVNAVSHIAFGDEAAAQDSASMKYTATGLALNAAAVTSWAALYELLFRDHDKADLGDSLIRGAVVSALAYVTDYHVVPDRLTPGFEKRLSNRSLLAVYVTLAAALGLGGYLGESHDA